MKTLMRMAVQVLAVASLLSITPASAQNQRPPFPQVELPAKAQGEQAIIALGNSLPAVAAAYGMSTNEFARKIRTDRSMWVDTRGRVFFVDPIPDSRTPPVTKGPVKRTSSLPQKASDSLTLTGSLAPLDQTFKLHSKPGANRTIYLNFVGATVTNTVWTGTGSIYAPPFDFDGAPNTFSQAELERIQYIWQRVAEDYAPFDVDITTEQPPQDRISRSGTNDQVFGTVVLITTRSSGLYSCSCGGVAYLGVFDDTSDYSKPALVFYDALGGGNEKYVAEAISHEAGHNVGLSHDGTSTTNYYSGSNGWAPIMGTGYYQNTVTWSRGEYVDANNTQDDYAVMASNGLPVRPDDHGNSTGTATAVTGTLVNGFYVIDGSGVVQSPSDVDFFSFVAGAGNLTVTTTVANRSSNLNARVRLYDSSGNLLQEGVSFSYTVTSAGTYYVSVEGVGVGDLADYGSLGEFAVKVSATAPASLPPTAVLNASPLSGVTPLAVNVNSVGSFDPDGSIVSYEWNFGDGDVAQGQSFLKVYTIPGTYTITLKVTDNSGLSASKSVTVNVSPVLLPMSAAITQQPVMARARGKNQWEGTATVQVTSSGAALAGVTVTGQWSTGGTVSGVTDANGRVSFVARIKSGQQPTVVFQITGVTKSGYVLQ